ncbi:MAG: 4Fe-4S binding protein [Nitrospiraceae bacterium]|nr:MAG: 4Fe-4S binding protein [Nitrospiraceae bacterium]
MQTVRRISQGIFLLLFLFLFVQTQSKGADELGYPVKIFLDFDPLIFVTTLLSSHSVQKAFYFSLVIIIATLALGRVFCGWACPLGTLNNMAGAIRKRRPAVISISWNRVKYYMLIFLVASSLFTLQLAGIIDPISLLIRSFAISICPLFEYSVRGLFDAIYAFHPAAADRISEPVYSVLKQGVLSFQQPSFNQSAFIGVLFLVIIGLNLVQKRFWCRNLCPLGALLGVLSKYSLLKRSVSEGCNECGACASVCQGNANPDKKEGWKNAECLYCWNCDDICPQNAVSFGFGGGVRGVGIDLGRRRIVASALGGIITVPLIRVSPLASSVSLSPELIRPPGSLEEGKFLRRCVKCGECMKVCITNGLQPAFLESGLEGLWSPVLVPIIGYCEFRCTLCGQVCPTGAIQRLSLEDKIRVKIGLAMIDKGRCLPYAHSTPCIVCEEVCPTPRKAIWFEEAVVKDRGGREHILKQPRVDLDLCIGCGICEAKCPVKSRPAIYVTNIGESRPGGKQLLLS